MRDLVVEMGLKPAQFLAFFGSVTGQKVSTPLFESMEIIGKEKVLERIKSAEILLRSSNS
jgi:glutamyl-tRNA synthetase